MSPAVLLLIALAAPVAQAGLVAALARPPGLRDVLHIGFSLLLAGVTIPLLFAAGAGETGRVVLARPLPGVELAFSLEPLGALMAAASACLGGLASVYTVGYARAVGERAPARLMAFIALAQAGAAAVAFSANLFTFFVAYQALTLATFPLVALGGDDDARRAARTYLGTLLTASIGLFLPAMVWTYAVAGALDFQPGGVLAGRVDVFTANALLILFVLGLATTGLPPMHRWLPVSSGASYPALIAVQATAVLMAGGVGLVKIAAYVFGPALAQAALAAQALVALAGATMCVAALIALSKQDLRERLAYSCMAQAAAAAMGALLGIPAGLFAAALQIVALACGAATLLMAAGAVYVATGRRDAADTKGLGRLMPWTFAGFALASASMIGMPPFAGAWPKLWLISAAANSGLIWAAVLAGGATVLTFAHLGPLAANALVGRASADVFKRPDGASILLVAPVALCAGATLCLLLIADPLSQFLTPLWSTPP